MSKVESLKELYKRATGEEIDGETICEVLDNMFAVTPKKIILASSTAESTKKFEITVTDDGTVTATEVVEEWVTKFI
mgnify:FL=1